MTTEQKMAKEMCGALFEKYFKSGKILDLLEMLDTYEPLLKTPLDETPLSELRREVHRYQDKVGTILSKRLAKQTGIKLVQEKNDWRKLIHTAGSLIGESRDIKKASQLISKGSTKTYEQAVGITNSMSIHGIHDFPLLKPTAQEYVRGEAAICIGAAQRIFGWNLNNQSKSAKKSRREFRDYIRLQIRPYSKKDSAPEIIK